MRAIVRDMNSLTIRENKFFPLLLYMMALLAFATALYVRIRLLGTPLERDEGEYAYMGQLFLKGIPPYTHAYTMKLPGVALVYAFFMAIFGQSATAIHIGLIFVNAACTGLVYVLGRRLFSTETAIVAAAFYTLLSLSGSVMGTYAHATHLVVLFSLAGGLLLDSALGKKHLFLIFLAGICLGAAFLMKQHAAALIVFALAFLIWQQRKNEHKDILRDCLLFLSAVSVPYVSLLIWVSIAGVFDRFWFWTVQYALEYAAGSPAGSGLNNFVTEFYPIFTRQLPLWVLASAGIIAACKKERKGTRFLLSGYLVVSLLMTAAGLYFRPHYFILLLPSIALLAAYATISVSRSKAISKRVGQILSLLLFAGSMAYVIYAERDYLFRLTPNEVSRKIHSINPFPEAIHIAEYLHSETTDKDRIAILGSEPEILFYADRLSATGHIYMYGLMENHRYAAEMQQQLIGEIESAAPKFIVVINAETSWKLQESSLNRIQEWGDSYMPPRYDEVGMVEISSKGTIRYLWGEEAAGREPEANSFVSIYRRKW